MSQLRCIECGLPVTVEELVKCATAPGGHKRHCKKCDCARKKRQYRDDPQRHRDRKVAEYWANREKKKEQRHRLYWMRQPTYGSQSFRKYGMTVGEYDTMFAAQAGKCAICRQPETATRLGKVRKLCVDHDHETGRIRGLLCSDCNFGIGMLKENPQILEAAAKYLEGKCG